MVAAESIVNLFEQNVFAYLLGGMSESSSCQIVIILHLMDFFLFCLTDFLVKLSDTMTGDKM